MEKFDALFSEPVDVRGLDVLMPVGSKITPALVIRQYLNEVRFRWFFGY